MYLFVTSPPLLSYFLSPFRFIPNRQLYTMGDDNELKPGQKFPTPTPGLGDRVFYESLYRQRPESVMAQEW